MAKKISSRDLFEQEDIFKGIRDSADQTMKKLNTFKTQLTGLASETKKAFSGLKMTSTKEIDQLIKLTEKANKINKQSIQISNQQKTAAEQKRQAEMQLLKIEQEKEKLTQQQMRTQKMKNTENERSIKQAERQKKQAQDQANAYKKLEKNTRDLKNESKRLGAEMLALEQSGRKNSQEYRKLATEYNKVTRAAQQGDAALKKLDKTVGDNFRNVGNYKSALSGLTGILGGLGVGLGIGGIMRSTLGIIANFDQAQADLAAISGKTKDELAGLTAQAKELGATTQFSATQITDMQIELAKLGFSTDQISESTEAVSNFAAATGADIPRAAALAGSALRGFNLPASEMERVVSTLGVATTKTALDFSKLEAGLSTVAPVAASFGFSIEDTTALLGQLSNAGFDASSAATATRNILLNLADANGDLAQALGRPITSAEDLAGALQELDARGIDLAESLELTDKRSVAAFQTFIKQSGSLVELKNSITDVNDELKDMAAKRLDSINGQLTLLSSAWEGFILGTNDATGASDKLKSAIGFLAENLSTIMDVVIRLVRFWAVYKTTTIAVNQVNKIMAINFSAIGKSLAALVPRTKAYRLQQIQLARATKGATTAVKGFGAAMKTIPWGVVVGAAVELYYWLSDTDDATQDLEESTNELAEAQERERGMVADATGEFVGLVEQLKATNANSEERYKLINQINSQYGTTLQNLQDETAFQAQLNQAVADYITFQKLKIQAQLGQEKTTALIKEQIALTEELGETGLFATEQQLRQAEALTGQFRGAELEKELRRVSPLIEKLYKDIEDAAVNAGQAGAQYGFGGITQEQQKAYDNLTNTLIKLGDVQFQLNQEGITQLDLQAEINKFNYKTPTAGVTNYGKGAKGAAGSTKEFNTELKELNKYLDRQKQLLFELKEIEMKAGIEATERRIKKEFDLQIENIKKTGNFDATELNNLIKYKATQEELYIKRKRDFETISLQEQYAREKAARQKALDDEKAKLLSQKDITKAAQKEIEANYKIRQGELNAQEKVREKNLQQEIKIINEEANKEIENINRNKTASIKANEEKLTESIENEAEKRKKIADDEAKEELAKLKEIEEAKREIVKISADYFIKQSDKKIAQIDKEIAAAEKQADTLRELAAQGNINAQESLAEQEKIIAESNRRKEQEQKRQQRIRLAESVYSTYSAKVESGSENPLAETIRDTTLLQAFINSLPTFEVGTEDTGKHGEGVDGKGGFHAILHPNERVIPKSLNEQIGNLSNEELTRIAQEYNAGKMIQGAQSGSSLEFALLVNEIKDLKNVIKDKPETNIELGQITQSAMDIVKSYKKGNTTTYNRYRVRK